MKIIFLFILGLVFMSAVSAQNDIDFEQDRDALPVIGLKKWFKKTTKYCTKNYPESIRKKGIDGEIHVQFIVEKDGSLSNVVILKGLHE